MKLAVVLANLGGPDGPQAVRPFLFNLFNDAAIIGIPQPFRSLLAQALASRRAPIAAQIYARMGGSSPILAQTLEQARALERALADRTGVRARVFVSMRYWHPFVHETAQAVREWSPDRIVLLPLFPQFSTTTTASFFTAWDRACAAIGLKTPAARLCCHPLAEGFIAAHAALLAPLVSQAKAQGPFRILFSAHGLPKRIVEKGDPYPWQVQQTAEAIMSRLGEAGLDWRIAYQSRVGPLAWLTPSTEAEIDRAGGEGKGLIILPVAFVSEHSETLVELDQDYAARARANGVPFYLRVPALGAHPLYIETLARLAVHLSGRTGLKAPEDERLCPAGWRCCPIPSVFSEQTA